MSFIATFEKAVCVRQSPRQSITVLLAGLLRCSHGSQTYAASPTGGTISRAYLGKKRGWIVHRDITQSCFWSGETVSDSFRRCMDLMRLFYAASMVESFDQIETKVHPSSSHNLEKFQLETQSEQIPHQG